MRGSLLLLSALLLLESTDGNGYDQLSQSDKKIIDRAIEAANERHGKAKHLDFDSIITVVSYLIQMLNLCHFTVCFDCFLCLCIGLKVLDKNI